MQWSDVIKPPPPKLLRQFAGLWLVFFGGLAAWRYWHGQTGGITIAIAVAAVVVGVAGLIVPAVVRPVFSGWMVLAFPIGWTLSKVALALVFYAVFTPVGVLFRMTGRDALRLHRAKRDTYWMPKPAARSGEDYLRQY